MSDTPFVAPVPAAADAPGTTLAAGQSPEALRTLAAQFESLLLTQLLNSMRSSMFGDDENADSGFAKGPLADALYGELSLAISRSGGVGLGKMMMTPLLEQTSGAAPLAMDASNDLAGGLTAVSARVTSAYGWRRDPIDGTARLHKGTDIALPVGYDVPAAGPGEVAFVGEQSGYGLTVVINHDGQRSTRYAHLSEATVRVGDLVTEGQVVARSGASGRVTGPHLHFELLENGRPVDPAGRLGQLLPAIQISDSRFQK